MQVLSAPWRVRAKQVLFTCVNTLFPPVCAGCRQPGALLCQRCHDEIEWLYQKDVCQLCSLPLNVHHRGCPRSVSPLQHIWAATTFTHPLPPLIHQLKYKGRFGLAKPLAELLVHGWFHHDMPVDLVIPIPLHSQRKQQRGYNQSALLAEQFCKTLTYRYNEQALQRVRSTNPQVNLSATERRKNVQGAFIALPDFVAHKHILLIDDVCTTGSTLAEAAKALLAANAKTVSAYCLARAV